MYRNICSLIIYPIFLLLVLLSEVSEGGDSQILDARFVSIRGAILLIPEGNLLDGGYFLLDSGVRVPVLDRELSALISNENLVREYNEGDKINFKEFLKVPELSVSDVIIDNLLPLSHKLGVRILGVVPIYFPGYEVFLDFNKGRVQWRLFSLTDEKRMKKVSFVKLAFSEENQFPQVLVVLNDSRSFMANMDLTKGESIGLPMRLLSRKELGFNTMKFAYFYGKKEICYFRLDSIKVGEVRLKNAIGVSSVEEKDIWIGTRFWRNFGIVMNYELGKVYLIGDKKELAEKEWTGTGILLDCVGNDGWRVGVIEGSPAWRSDICPGDELLFIDGESVVGFSVEELLQKLNGAVGTGVKCVFKKIGGEKKEIFLISESIL